MSAVYALDVGTSSVRAALIDHDGRVLATERVERLAGEGAERFDPERLWEETLGVVRALTRQPGLPVGEALTITAHVGTVFLDASDTVVGASGGWSDRRGLDDPTWLPDPGQLVRLGRPVLTGGALPAYLATRATDAELARRIALILSPKDLLLLRLTGERVTDRTSAGYTLAFDVGAARWADDLLVELDVDPSLFPNAAAGSALAGTVLPSIAAATGLPAGLPVVHGGPDGSIALYGILGDADDAIADVAGTTDVLGRRVGASSRRFARAVVNIAPDGRGLLAGGPTGFTGGAAAWWAAKLGFADVASAVAADAGSLGFSGVLVQPALTGSRFPHWDQSARGAIARTGDPDRARVMRGVQEGIAFTIRAALQAMTDSADERQVVVALAGGSARSPRIVQLRADVTGYSVLAVRDPDAGLRGAATLGFAGLGLPRPEALVRDSRATRYDPDPALSAEYDAAFQAWSAWIAAGYRGAETFGIPPVGSS